MLVEVKKYPLDLTGAHPDNLLASYPHDIQKDDDRIVILPHGTFFGKSVTITVQESGQELLYGKDYVFNYLHEEATERATKPVYGVIVIKNLKLRGTILITVQLVGGIYGDHHGAIEKALEDLQTVDKDVYWDYILNKPLYYPPEQHRHTMDDIEGVDGIVAGLDEIAGAVAGQRPSKLKVIEDKLETKVSNSGNLIRGIHDIVWRTTQAAPLRVRVQGYPEAISIDLRLWDNVHGASKLTVSGRLSKTGQWSTRNYMVTGGIKPDIELLLTDVDGASAELLMRTTSQQAVTVVFDSVTYYNKRPADVDLSFMPMATYPTPIGEGFVTPVYPWNV